MTRKNLFTFGSAVLTALFATSVMADQANTGAGDFFNNSNVEKLADDLWLGVKGQSNREIAGSPRNLFR